MQEEELYGDIIFTRYFHNLIMTPHFEFLQSQGDCSKVASFNSNNILVCFFLLEHDLKNLLDGGWKEHPAFAAYVEHLWAEQWPTESERYAGECEKSLVELSIANKRIGGFIEKVSTNVMGYNHYFQSFY